MAIFGRITARQRLRRATRESLAIPAFSSPVDCTPWVTGGLWPAELSTVTAETATLAEYLKADLRTITESANDELKVLKRAGMPDFTRQAEEARVIEEARARAVRRVESTMRHLHAVKAEMPAEHVRPQVAESVVGPDLDETQAIPAIDAATSSGADEEDKPEALDGRHRASADDDTDGTAAAPESEASEASEAFEAPEAFEGPVAPVAPAASESDQERLRRLLAFVIHQEPRLNWAIGDRSDGTTVLVTDLAHGWIPPGITLPAGVRLLEPERRSGKVSSLIGDSTRTLTYAPGDSLGRLDDFAGTDASAQPRELPAVQDLGWELNQATHWRDGLPRMVHTLARAAAAGTGIAEEEIDLLRVHLDTARYQLLTQYPNVDLALLLNCMLLAATEGAVTGDSVSANYHLAWFQKLVALSGGL